MSVPESKRKEGELKVITRARQLTARVLTICSNEKHFPKRLRWCYTQNIVKACTNMFEFVNRANSIFVKTQDDALVRNSLWKEALSESISLYSLIDLSYELRQVNLETTKSLIEQIYQGKAENRVLHPLYGRFCSTWKQRGNGNCLTDH